MNDVERLRAMIFSRTGIAIEADDPLVAVLIASAFQAEEVGQRLVKASSPLRVVVLSSAIAIIFGAIGAWTAWQFARAEARVERADWLRLQSDPRLAALIRSQQGRAGLHLAELGVATILASCSGRPSWHVTSGYCIPTTSDGAPDGFTFKAHSGYFSSRGNK